MVILFENDVAFLNLHTISSGLFRNIRKTEVVDEPMDVGPLSPSDDELVEKAMRIAERLAHEEARLSICVKLRANQLVNQQKQQQRADFARDLGAKGTEQSAGGAKGVIFPNKGVKQPPVRDIGSTFGSGGVRTADALGGGAQMRQRAAPVRDRGPQIPANVLIQQQQMRQQEQHEFQERQRKLKSTQQVIGERESALRERTNSFTTRTARMHEVLEKEHQWSRASTRREIEREIGDAVAPKDPDIPKENLGFVPSANCPDFLFLIGLQDVVQAVLDAGPGTGKKSPRRNDTVTAAMEIVDEEPYLCNQCETDFTPSWWRDSETDTVLCVSCLKSLTKKCMSKRSATKLRDVFKVVEAKVSAVGSSHLLMKLLSIK